MSQLDDFLQQLNTQPETIEFQTVIDLIDAHYHYTPVPFRNGPESDCVISEAGENQGSCKIFAFAKLHQLDQQQTLHCFGRYYREDVLQHPDATNHANIRNFMKYGWNTLTFAASALKARQP